MVKSRFLLRLASLTSNGERNKKMDNQKRENLFKSTRPRVIKPLGTLNSIRAIYSIRAVYFIRPVTASRPVHSIGPVSFATARIVQPLNTVSPITSASAT